MNRLGTFLGCAIFWLPLGAQQAEGELLAIKKRLDSIRQYEVSMSLDIIASFVNMPTKYARMTYERGKGLSFDAENFILIPRRGLDFSLNQLFKQPFLTLDRGTEKRGDTHYKAVNLIPNHDGADYTIARLLLDTLNHRIAESEIHTRHEGSFKIQYTYKTKRDILPERVDIAFELQHLNIPFNFLGKDAEIDRKAMREEEAKKGSILLRFGEYDITYFP